MWENLTNYSYRLCRPMPVFEEASKRQGIVDVLRAGSIVRGGLPSSSGWIPLDDDELWLFDDGRSLELMESSHARRPFVRHIPLPSSVDVNVAALEEHDDRLIITLPYSNRMAKHAAGQGLQEPTEVMVEAVESPPAQSASPSAHEGLAQEPIKVTVTAVEPAHSPPCPRASPPTLARTLSAGSKAVMDALRHIDDQMKALQKSSDEAEIALHCSGASGLNLGLRSQLGQMHGDANSLLGNKIDAILISSLVSGKEAARLQRKALIKQAESLIERVEGQVKRFDEIRAHASSSTTAVQPTSLECC